MDAFQRSSLRMEADDVLDPAEPSSQRFAARTHSPESAGHGWRRPRIGSGSTVPSRSGVADVGMGRWVRPSDGQVESPW
jgi:hypothetical protein